MADSKSKHKLDPEEPQNWGADDSEDEDQQDDERSFDEKEEKNTKKQTDYFGVNEDGKREI